MPSQPDNFLYSNQKELISRGEDNFIYPPLYATPDEQQHGVDLVVKDETEPQLDQRHPALEYLRNDSFDSISRGGGGRYYGKFTRRKVEEEVKFPMSTKCYNIQSIPIKSTIHIDKQCCKEFSTFRFLEL